MQDFTPTESSRLADYLAGELSNSDAADVERWINEDPARQLFVKTVSHSRLHLGSEGGHVSPEVRSQFEQLSKNLVQVRAEENGGSIVSHAARVSRLTTNKNAWFNKLSATYVTASIFVGILLVFVGLQTAKRPNRSIGETALSSYTTKSGERATVTLSDGTTIVLNVASKVQVPTNYSSENRTVYLSGEAYFSVNHYEGMPFTVVSGPSTTRVLGTRFAVRHYPSDTAAQVTVEDGKVSVEAKVVAAGQQISVSHDFIGHVESANLARLSFASGKLTIDDIQLTNAIVELNRWYDADIRLGDPSLTGRKVFGVFRSGSLTDLEMMLEWAFNVRVERDGRVLTLYPRD